MAKQANYAKKTPPLVEVDRPDPTETLDEMIGRGSSSTPKRGAAAVEPPPAAKKNGIGSTLGPVERAREFQAKNAVTFMPEGKLVGIVRFRSPVPLGPFGTAREEKSINQGKREKAPDTVVRLVGPFIYIRHQPYSHTETQSRVTVTAVPMTNVDFIQFAEEAE